MLREAGRLSFGDADQGKVRVELSCRRVNIATPGFDQLQQREAGGILEGTYMEFPSRFTQLKLLISFPQHSGRCGRLDLSHPPPRAWINNTALAMRRPRILTAVTSSVSAAF